MSPDAGASTRVRYHFTFLASRPGHCMSFVQANWMLITVFVLSGAMLVWPYFQRGFSKVKDVSSAEATRLLNRQDAVMLDVREPKEYEGGRLPHSIHIPLSQLAGRTSELAKLVSKPVVAYCENGRRGPAAAPALAKAGFKEIYNLQGGIAAWKKDGLPVEK
jgi:rhodanese-related sulfurtransferase